MALITYEDKVALNENPDIEDINKCKATDMNEIKNVVNTNYYNTPYISSQQPTNGENLWIEYRKQEPYTVSNIKINDNGVYEKLTDTVSIGIDSNNAGVLFEVSKNLATGSRGSTTQIGITSTYLNSEINLNGTSTSSGSILGDSGSANPNALKIGTFLPGTYTFDINKISGSITIPSGAIALYFRNGASKELGSASLNNNFTRHTRVLTFTEKTDIYLQIYNNTKDIVYSNFRFQVYAVKGSYTSTTMPPFEPYVSPNIKVNNNGVYEKIASKPLNNQSNSNDDSYSCEYINNDNYFKAGDTWGYNTATQPIYANGFMTSSSTSIIIDFYLPKKTDKITNIVLNEMTVIVRGISGYINSGSGFSTATEGITFNPYKRDGNRLSILINSTEAFTNAVNNTPVSVEIRTYKFTFN